MSSPESIINSVCSKNVQTLTKLFESHQSLLVECYDDPILEKSLTQALQKKYCTQQQTEACGQCTSCLSIFNHNFELVRVLKPESDFYKVSQFRELNSFVQRQTQSQRWLWVTEAHKFNKETANAFLKTLEEPSLSLKIILSTSNKAQIIQTLLSRAIPITLSCLGPQDFEGLTENYYKNSLYDSKKILNQSEAEKRLIETEQELLSLQKRIMLDFKKWGKDKEEFIQFLKDVLWLNHLHLTGKKENINNLKTFDSAFILKLINHLNKNADPKINFNLFLSHIN